MKAEITWINGACRTTETAVIDREGCAAQTLTRRFGDHPVGGKVCWSEAPFDTNGTRLVARRVATSWSDELGPVVAVAVVDQS